ncbi:MAG: hypothetical protein JW967_03795 [Dehalococcoidales bacterium]|nr:hypothetical protein [Dehalococcoidales bacterium]
MVTARDKALINQVKIAALSLRRASIWVSSKIPLNVTDNFIFELYVLFRLILDLQSAYNVKYIPGSGVKKNNFAKNPAEKQGRPKFEIYEKPFRRLLWQICSGTEIVDKFGDSRAPDISFQTANSPDTPTYQDIEIIWDAKYKKTFRRKITHAEFSTFMHFINALNLRNKVKPNINLADLRYLVDNCLVTNGEKSTELDVSCADSGLKEVTSFYPGNTFSVRP